MRQDRDFIEDMLSSEKALSKFYTVATTECGTPTTRTTMKNVLNCALDMQEEVYQTMANRGWYSPDEAETEKVNQAKTQFCHSPSEN